jgi:hypothetical protein
MAASICGARNSRGAVSQADVNARLAAINAVYPGTAICCVMAPTGDVLCVVATPCLPRPATQTTHVTLSTGHVTNRPRRAQHTSEGIKFDEAQAVIATLKMAAINFGEAAGALDCHVIHIKGISHIFSCYDIGRSGNVRPILLPPPHSAPSPLAAAEEHAVPALQLLAFYSEMHATSIELFDTEVADVEMAPILEVINNLLKQLAAP